VALRRCLSAVVPFSIEWQSLHGAVVIAMQTKNQSIIVKWLAAIGSISPAMGEDLEYAMEGWTTKFKH
jgi:hypothetical protein